MISDPNRWQPITFPNGQTPGFLTPHWGLVTPFVVQSGDGARPVPPALYPDVQYIRQARAIRRLRATLTDRQKVIAHTRARCSNEGMTIRPFVLALALPLCSAPQVRAQIEGANVASEGNLKIVRQEP